MRHFGRFAHWVGDAAGSPAAFCAALALIVVWAVAGPFLHFSELWQLTVNTATTIITFLMVFLLQHTSNRDTRAIQKKLDGLVAALDRADNRLIGLEKREEGGGAEGG